MSGNRRAWRLLWLVSLLALGACAGEGTGSTWTYAPVPTRAASEEPSPAPPTGTPGSAPAESRGSEPSSVVFDVRTPEDAPLTFVPDRFEAAPESDVTVNYLNDSALPHNIRFFRGPDPSAESIAATEVVTGPGNSQSVSFGAPADPGDYFFHCDVHPQQMQGTMVVTP